MMPTKLDALRFKELNYTAEEKVRDTKLFLGTLRYSDIEVLVKSVTENGVVVFNRASRTKVVYHEDMSFASWHFAQQSAGRWMLLKIRKWS